MAQVLRLLRYGLLLRLMVELAGIALGAILGRLEQAINHSWLIIPNVLILVVVLVYERQKLHSARTVNILLAAAIAAYVFDTTVGTLAFQSKLLNPASELRQRMSQCEGVIDTRVPVIVLRAEELNCLRNRDGRIQMHRNNA